MSRRDAEASAWFARMRGPDAADHRRQFDDWRSDPANAAAYAAAEEDWLVAGGVARSHVAARGETRTAARGAPMRWAFATIAATAIALGFAWHVRKGASEPQLAERTVRDADRVLPDGSHIWLADGARAEIRFAPNERRIFLFGGRGRFEVAHDATRPFIVEAEGSETIALGTEFEIDLTGEPVLVHLIKGKVEVRAIGTTSAVRLAPGGRASVEHRVASLMPPMLSPVTLTTLEADAMPLADVVTRANAVNAIPIRLAEPELGHLAVTGRFDLADASKLARKLAAALDLEVKEGLGTIIISDRPKKTGG